LAHVEEGVLALGRYFPTADTRNAETQLSPLILAAKNDPARADEVARLFASAADNPEWSNYFDLVCSVPPKPGANYDRFTTLLAAGAEEVVVLGLGLTQNALPETCPQCGVGTLKVIRRRRDGKPFLGCVNWFTTGCTYTRDL